MKQLQTRLGYKFNDSSILKLALTHRSFASTNNERLEFLGDSILDFVIAEALYIKFPQANEGQLTRLRSQLVKGDMLAKLAANLDLKDSIILGESEIKGGGSNKKSILANTMEAIFAAVFLDSNIKKTKQVILKIYQSILKDLTLGNITKDAKSLLQEYLQKHNNELPKYELIEKKGDDHDAIFIVKCSLASNKLSIIRQANSIKKAEQICAKKLLEKLL